MRLNRYLAACGLGSRRACEELIRSGAVRVGGRAVSELATVVAEGEIVEVRGRVVRPASLRYYLLHKPPGVVTSHDAQGKRPTVFDLLPPEARRLGYVGRLDADSEGLLLFTNDGELTQALTHPSRHVEKEYEVLLEKEFDPSHAKRLLDGIHLDGRRARARRVRLAAPQKLVIVLTQGLNRQIRRMLDVLGYRVRRLVRVRFGSLRLAALPRGAVRALEPEEIRMLRASGAERRPAHRPRAASRERAPGRGPRERFRR